MVLLPALRRLFTFFAQPSTNGLRCVAAAALMAGASQANAALVTFDDLPWNPGPWGHFGDQPITDQYASLGLLVQEGYLARENSPATGQYLLGGQSFALRFTGTLPTHVSFNFSSAMAPMEAYAYANNGAGTQFDMARTGGYFYNGNVEGGIDSVMPYVSNRLVSFASATGISSVYFGTPGGTRVSATIDNLYFGAVPAVPEPSALLLFAAGAPLLVAAARRRNSQRG